ncbi:hypothetical protein DL96DRAFT_1712364 [Flagelloscypha sp. PMI_526]|nr:hypothetical protein DL96DRAFT_1712364 [Flagelloscypha sp. PMI_526]
MSGQFEGVTFEFVDQFPEHGFQNKRLKLVPYSPQRHTAEFLRMSGVDSERDMYRYLSFGPFDSVETFDENFFRTEIENDPSRILFAIIDKTRESRNHRIDEEGCLAGIIGLLNFSPHNLLAEIGYLMILHPYRGKHVLSNAVGLLIKWLLDPPSKGGIGFRRVAWKCSSLNQTSRSNAEALTFQLEGVLRWDMVLNAGGKKHGNCTNLRREDPKPNCKGASTAVYSIVWDDFDMGGRDELETIMQNAPDR